MAILAATWAYRSQVRPVRDLEAWTPPTPWEAAPVGATGELNALKHRFKVQAGELGALHTHKQALSDEVEKLLATQKSALTTLTAAVALTQDMLILTDAEARIRDISPTALELLDQHRADVLGKLFYDVVKLYDLEKERPEEYPMAALVSGVIESRSTIPRLEQALLVNRVQRREKVFVAATAILESGSSVIGAMVRLDPAAKDGSVGTHSLSAATSQSASTDRTTGLPNADMLERRLEELVKIARAQQAAHAIVFLSPDGFDRVNDQFGHRAGEELMWQIAQALKAGVPTTADCFRVSSTHFAVLLPLTPVAEATRIAERLRVDVDGRDFKWQDLSFEATISAGVVPIPPEAESHKVLMGLADGALSRAKANGGNQVHTQLPDGPLVTRRRQDREWVSWVAKKLKEGHGHLISQAIEPMNPASGLPPMLEVLMRIEDDDGAWVQPGAFLPSIIRHNLSAQIDVWLLKRTLRVLAEQSAQLSRYGGISINLARSSITESNFAERVNEVLAEAPAAASNIIFEVDAQTAINHPSDVHRFVTTVQPTGARFALDRCRAALGLSTLTSLPIEFVKVHESLVRKAMGNAVDRGYVQWINQVTHQLGRKTVATGIETAAAQDAMRSIGIDYAQGVQINKMGPLMV